jgi:Yip1 domain
MSFGFWRTLAVLSVTKPADAARQLLAMQVPSNILWMVLFLVTIGNTIVFTFSDLLAPAPGPLSGFLSTPFMMLFLVAGGLILTVFSIHFCGRILGGHSTFDGVLVLIVWLQILRLVVQIVVLFLMITLPFLSALLVIVSAFVWLYMLVHFVNQSHQFNSLGRSAGVLVVSIIIPAIGIAVLLALLGVPLTGTV